jgi:hypothetical protein
VLDYFAEQHVYDATFFSCRFKMRRELSLQIVYSVTQFYPYFEHRVDDVGQMDLSVFQECIAPMRMLVYSQLRTPQMNIDASQKARLWKPWSDLCQPCIVAIFVTPYLCKF